MEKSNYIPRVAAFHDLCGYGNCSLGIAIPVLSAAGCDVCSVPTGLFSAHTLYPTFFEFDTTELLEPYIRAWQEEKVELDAVYSGFLSNEKQVKILLWLLELYPQAMRIIDPVMGDHGSLYPTYTQKLCDETRKLVSCSHVLLPNVTEACLLTETPYKGDELSDDEIRALLLKLVEMGARSIILTGVQRAEKILNCVLSDSSQDPVFISKDKHPFSLHGTGDLFASCVCAALMNGCPLMDAAEFATQFVYDAMTITLEQPQYKMRGVSFEPLLGRIAALHTAKTHIQNKP